MHIPGLFGSFNPQENNYIVKLASMLLGVLIFLEFIRNKTIDFDLDSNFVFNW